MTILDKIVIDKHKEVDLRKSLIPIKQLEQVIKARKSHIHVLDKSINALRSYCNDEMRPELQNCVHKFHVAFAMRGDELSIVFM